MKLVKETTLPIIMSALNEDIGEGDLTTNFIFEKGVNVSAVIIARQDCVLCGIDVARWVFSSLDDKIILKPFFEDRARVKKGGKVLFVKGSIKSILAAERTALNFLSRLSGISSLTDKFVKKVKGTDARIFDTRKTTPGLRVLEKYAVKIGGGFNHRKGLSDGILVKDNHLSVPGISSIEEVVMLAKSQGYKNIEVEVNDLKEFKVALEAGADIIMLDNMSAENVKKAVKMRNARPQVPGSIQALEVSGGVTLENVHGFAKTGVDRISIGSLTHSAPSVDFSLEIRT